MPAFVRVCLRYEPCHRHLDEVGVCDEAVTVVECDLLGLDKEMDVIGTEEIELAQFIGLEEIEHLQDGESLGGRRRLVYRHPSIGRGDGLGPPGALLSEIALGEEAAVGPREARELAPRLSLIEARAAV